MKKKYYRYFALILVIYLVSCSSLPPSSNNFINYKVANGSNSHPISNILILPTEVVIAEIFPGGVFEKSPEWARVANNNLGQQLVNSLGAQSGIVAKDVGGVDSFVDDIKRQMPFLRLVVGAMRKHTSGWDAWPHKINKFDYSIGNGLGFLNNKNIDAALFVVGGQMNHKNKLAPKDGNILTYPKEHITFGDLYMSVCLIAIDSGDILWFKNEKYRNVDLRQTSDVNRLISHMLSTYPKKLMVFKNEQL